MSQTTEAYRTSKQLQRIQRNINNIIGGKK